MTTVEIDVGMYALLWTSIAVVILVVFLLFIAARWAWNVACFYITAFVMLIVLGVAAWAIIRASV